MVRCQWTASRRWGDGAGRQGAHDASHVDDDGADGLVAGTAAAIELELHVEEADVESAGDEAVEQLGDKQERDDGGGEEDPPDPADGVEHGTDEENGLATEAVDGAAPDRVADELADLERGAHDEGAGEVAVLDEPGGVAEFPLVLEEFEEVRPEDPTTERDGGVPEGPIGQEAKEGAVAKRLDQAHPERILGGRLHGGFIGLDEPEGESSMPTGAGDHEDDGDDEDQGRHVGEIGNGLEGGFKPGLSGEVHDDGEGEHGQGDHNDADAAAAGKVLAPHASGDEVGHPVDPGLSAEVVKAPWRGK